LPSSSSTLVFASRQARWTKASCIAAGGAFEIESQRGKGTSFIFRFTSSVVRDVWAPTVPPPKTNPGVVVQGAAS
jgi:hypothetical protein